MRAPKYFPVYPEKILWVGFLVLGSGLLLSGGIAISLWIRSLSPLVDSGTRPGGQARDLPVSFSLDLNEGPLAVPLPDIQGEMTFSFDSSRPDGSLENPSLFIRLKTSGQSRRIRLPCRIDLQYEEGLSFSSRSTPFWVELAPAGSDQVQGRVFVSTSADERIEAGCFVAAAEESPIQSAEEFLEGTPFRALAEARWWGHDLFREKYGGGAFSERIELGPLAKSTLIDLEPGNWIAWKEGKWEKIAALEEGKNRPIARISARGSASLILEGWDLEAHIRLKLSPAQLLPFKAKGEDLFSSVRIRSEKQISCMLEKQCLILKVGDWVFKGENRWKVLRRKEEKDAYLSGKLVGELFFFDGIEVRGGQKMIQGNLFNAGRSQMIPIDIGTNAQKKNSPSNEPFSIKQGKKK